MTATTTLILAVISAISPADGPAVAATAASEGLVPIAVVTSELDRAMKVLKTRDEPPHYIAVAVEDRQEVSIVATAGTLFRDDAERDRWLDVDLRVGTPKIDSTHELRGTSGLPAVRFGAGRRVRHPADGVAGH